MQHNRLLSLLAALLCALLLLSACGGTPETADTEPVSSSAAPVITEEPTDPALLTGSSGLTLSGSKYNAEGFTVWSAGIYTFSDTLTLTFDTPIGTDVNRYSLTYSASKALEGWLHYTEGGAETSEKFYLEPGTDLTFSSFTEHFLDKKTVSGITSLEIRKKQGSNPTFSLGDLKVEKQAVPDENEVYMQNERFKVGIRLKWGGGISYLEDFTDGDDSISNLLNRADTGRLVQQSYYGTSSAPYKPATYNGTTWQYNPVQGGDQYGNHSRLIDYRMNEDGLTVYVKCLPMDWAQNNLPTMSYMENTYTLTSSALLVDNRFYDFSGYTNASERHQELPAFYTISYLSKFVYYAGNQGWTGGNLMTLANEPFWGDPKYNSQCYHNLKSKETWCAWVSPDTGWGIGEFTPTATILLAGRFSFNGSKDADNGATNYVAPLITYKMTPYKAFAYSYYITTGTTEQIRATFTDIYNTQIKK